MTRWIGLKEATRYARIGKDRLNASLAAQGNELDALDSVVEVSFVSMPLPSPE